jgi:hypothetical protein
MELIRPGELAHVHFQDVPDMPRELLDNTTRFIPATGSLPFSGFSASYQRRDTPVRYRLSCSCRSFNLADPYEVARRIRERAEPVLR